MTGFRRHLTYANVVATLALILALGLGGAWAAGKIGSKDLKRGAVKSKAIKDGQVKSVDVRDGNLAGVDLKDGSVGALDLASSGDPVSPALANGVENDCIWTDGTIDFPGSEPVTYRRNVLGEVVFTGFAGPVPGPGGDGACTTAGAEGIEDSTVTTIRPEDRPARTQIFANPTSSSIILVAGVNGVSIGMASLPAGTVFSPASDPVLLGAVRFLAADSPSSPPASNGRERISLRALRKLGL